MQTACKNCVFAKYKGKTQIDCKLGRIDKFRKHGTNIIEAYDHEKEFYVIDRVCIAFRTDKWRKAVKSLNQDIFKRVKDELVPTIVFIVLLSSKNELDELFNRLSEIDKLNTKPKRVVIADFARGVNGIKLFKQIEAKKYSFKFMVERLDPSVTHDEGIDIIVGKSREGYYTLIDVTKHIDCEPVEIIDQYVNEKMDRKYLYNLTDSKHLLTVFIPIHRFLLGNKDMNIVDKIKAVIDGTYESKDQCISVERNGTTQS